MNNEADKKLLCGMILHTCDFSGAAKKFKVSATWSKKISEEYTN